MKAVVVVLAILFLVSVALLLLFLLGWLQTLLLILGLAVFVMILGVLVISGLVLIVAPPYYVVTKRAEVVPGSYTLEQTREK